MSKAEPIAKQLVSTIKLVINAGKFLEIACRSSHALVMESTIPHAGSIMPSQVQPSHPHQLDLHSVKQG